MIRVTLAMAVIAVAMQGWEGARYSSRESNAQSNTNDTQNHGEKEKCDISESFGYSRICPRRSGTEPCLRAMAICQYRVYSGGR